MAIAMGTRYRDQTKESYMSVFIKRDHKPKLKGLEAMNEFPQLGDTIELFHIHRQHEGLDILKRVAFK